MKKISFKVKCTIKALLFLLLCNFKTTAQTCPTTTVCFPSGSASGSGTYVVLPIPVNLVNAVIIPDPVLTDWTGPKVKATKAACVTIGGINDTLDVLISIYKPDSATNSNKAFGGSGFTIQASGILGFNGAGYQTYLFTTNFYKTGTTTPVAINVLQQVRDCDGDGDYNNDGTKDDVRCDVALPSPLILDDYVYATGFSNYVLSTPTLVYTRISGIYTYFYSSGHDNAPAYSGISSIPAPTSNSATQGAIFVYTSASQIDFFYYCGQYGGVSIDYTAQNLLFPLPCTPAPIKLNYFTARKQDGFNTLNWQSSNEINSNHFNIERSYDGLNFDKIGVINTLNNSSGSSYFYNDTTHAQYTRIYYRLKMIDNNGSYSYSNVCLLKNSEHSALISIYPNSTKDIFTINIGDQLLQNTQAFIYDINGKRLKTITLTNQQQQVNISSFINGIYMLHFSNGITFKIIKQQ